MHEKHAKWGILFDILQTEEFEASNAIWDSSDCRISNVIKLQTKEDFEISF